MKKVLMVALGATMCLPMMAEKLSDVDSLKMFELQELQVRSLRATKNTPVAYTRQPAMQVMVLATPLSGCVVLILHALTSLLMVCL